MKVSEILQRRQQDWKELEQLCNGLVSAGGNCSPNAWTGILSFLNPIRAMFRFLFGWMFSQQSSAEDRRTHENAAKVARFAALYRAACADLALADAYQLPSGNVQYLHRLVGRAHNQLYRARRFDLAHWHTVLLKEVPQQIFHDRCVQLAFAMFWGTFVLAMAMAFSNREFAEKIAGAEMLTMMQEMHGNTPGSGSPVASPAMTSFYIQHNTSIGLKCFAGGLLVIPGIAVTLFNAGLLGAVFGYMARPDVPESGNFFNFVTAHGPFELTAIVLSAGAGLKLGMAWLCGRSDTIAATAHSKTSTSRPAGRLGNVVYTRIAALALTAKEAMPLMGAAILMFFMAALIEGFLSPSAAPYWAKAGVAIGSSVLLSFYFIVLGFPQR